MFQTMLRKIKWYIFGRKEKFTVINGKAFQAKRTISVADVFKNKHTELYGDDTCIRFFDADMDVSTGFYNHDIFHRICVTKQRAKFIYGAQPINWTGNDEYFLYVIVDGKIISAGTFHAYGLLIVEYNTPDKNEE